ncbi:MAG: HAD family hydrolase [Candidatus Dormibacteria bacterium]
MSRTERPLGVCFDYGRTLVVFSRPDRALWAAGASLPLELGLAESRWSGTAGDFALALDLLVDKRIGEVQRADPLREVEFERIHREAIHQLLGRWPSQALSDRVAAILQRSWAEGVAPLEAAREVLATLKARGLRLALCSNAPFPPHLMYEQLERFQLRQYFDAALFSSEIGWRKPDPRIFAEMLRRLGLPAAAVWFVGDEWEADIEGATGAGMRAILAPGASAGREGAEQLLRWGDLLTMLQ